MPVAIKSTSGGSVTIAAASTASDYTLTLPASTGTAVVSDGSGNLSVSGNLSFNSGYGSSAVAYGCRAWVNFNGTGTVAINASANVSSITDDGTGLYTVNFSSAIVDANYAVSGVSRASGSYANGAVITLRNAGAKTTSALAIGTSGFGASSIATFDATDVSVAVFR